MLTFLPFRNAHCVALPKGVKIIDCSHSEYSTSKGITLIEVEVNGVKKHLASMLSSWDYEHVLFYNEKYPSCNMDTKIRHGELRLMKSNHVRDVENFNLVATHLEKETIQNQWSYMNATHWVTELVVWVEETKTVIRNLPFCFHQEFIDGICHYERHGWNYFGATTDFGPLGKGLASGTGWRAWLALVDLRPDLLKGAAAYWPPQEGPKKVLKKYADWFEKFEAEEPVYNVFLHAELFGTKSRNQISKNQAFTTFVNTCSGYEQFRDELKKSISSEFGDVHAVALDYIRDTNAPWNILFRLPGLNALLKTKGDTIAWHKREDAKEQASMLGISEIQHPNLYKAFVAGEIPALFFQESSSENEPVNREFDLIEECLSMPGWSEVLIPIFQTAKSRMNYTRSVSSYLGFLRYFPTYLDKHAPRATPWQAMPSLKDSQWELEMGEANEEGTTKRRSAMTPIVDNDAGIVTIPYVSMRISGERTTYCYSEYYHVQEKYQKDPLGTGVFQRSLAEKLNGRDDYGLMFYTLTGTTINQGYPTFLIIFERLKGSKGHALGGTRVHIHRVRPNRFKNGVAVPGDHLIEECYRYMAGNIRAEEIAYQQGDMILVPTQSIGKALEPYAVSKIDNHSFTGESPVQFYPSDLKSKDNLLGYLKCDKPFNMPHPEHEDIMGIAPGIYALHRAKSFEANPVSISKYFID